MEAVIGIGDDIIATGMARGAFESGKKVAFGEGGRIIWGPHSAMVFRDNPNVLGPSEKWSGPVQWIDYYKGKRHYNSPSPRAWIWNPKFKVKPGEFFFDASEYQFAHTIADDFILLEPNLPWQKSVAVNKDWGFDRWQELVRRLRGAHKRVAQFAFGEKRLDGVEVIRSKTFRQAVAALSRARLAIVPEGGLHHAAAAVGIKAVVIFGGFIPPETMGYEGHINLTGNNLGIACGSLGPCEHCRAALNSITVDEVFEYARKI